jgi:hypothetical protein
MHMANGTSSNLVKIISFIVSIVVLTAGVVLWAANSHSELKEWAADRDHAVKIEIKEDTSDKYVRKNDFIQIKTLFEEHTKQHQKIIDKIDQIEEKIDREYRRH